MAFRAESKTVSPRISTPSISNTNAGGPAVVPGVCKKVFCSNDRPSGSNERLFIALLQSFSDLQIGIGFVIDANWSTCNEQHSRIYVS